MYRLGNFQRGLLCKPRIEVQAKAAFASLEEDYDPQFYEGTILSLIQNENYFWLRSMACLQIASVIPNDASGISEVKKCGSSIVRSMSLSEYIALQRSGMR